MKLKNPFSDKTRLLFIDVYSCFKCGSNQSVEMDHIMGRISNSPLNASPLCRKCHSEKAGYDGKIEQLRKTAAYLKKTEYKLCEKDLNFLEMYKLDD